MLVANTIKAWRRYLKIANITPDPEPDPEPDEQIQAIFEAIRQLMTPPEPKKRTIGFLVRERAARYGRR
jgi:hypothetical protein